MLRRDMSFFDQLERRWGWMAFPGFLRYYALFQVMVFVLQMFRPDLGALLAFDRDKIFAGEVWRVATMFFANGQFGQPGLFTILLLFFAVNFVFMISDGLEGAWGAFKTSLFYYFGIATTLVASFLYPFPIPYSGTMLFAASLLAFATLFPMVEILLFLILPVQMRFIGILTALGLAMAAFKFPILIPFFVLTLANYIIWAAIPAWRGTAMVLDASKRRKRFNRSKMPEEEAFHRCKVCGKTEATDPYLEFRIDGDGEEYCVDHLPD
jgi:hypothetical protein